jgi:predicted alpha/beta-hydrolase family hydrolase
MNGIAQHLADRGVATLRYQFPYMEQGRRSPNARSVLIATARSAVDRAAAEDEGLPLFAGGKSMGGRMTSLAASHGPLPGVRGIVFFGFPLHAAGKPSAERGAHLLDVGVPMLFLQGTRDRLADLVLLGPLCESLGDRATLHVVQGADHSFHLLKSSERSDDEVLEGLSETVATWIQSQQ